MPSSWIPLIASLLAAAPTPNPETTPDAPPGATTEPRSEAEPEPEPEPEPESPPAPSAPSSSVPGDSPRNTNANAHLEAARHHLDALAFREALGELDLALADRDNDREPLLEILTLRGVTAAAIDQPEVAGASFRGLLCLDPDQQLSRNYAPKIRNLFDEAHAWQQEQGALTFESEPTPVPDRLRVRVSRDPLSMARRVRFHFDVGDVHPFLLGGELREGVTEVEVPRSMVAGWWAELLGDRDAVLQRLGSDDAPLPFVGPRSPPTQVLADAAPIPKVDSPVLRWTAVGMWGAAGAALATGVVFGIRSSDARGQVSGAERDSQGRIVGVTQAQAQSLVDRSRRDGLTANVLFGASVGLALAGGGVWLWNQRIALAPATHGLQIEGSLP